MLKILRILGIKCRTTIPKVICLLLDLHPNDIISYTPQKDGTIILKKERICDNNCPSYCTFKENLTKEEAEELVRGLSEKSKRMLLVLLSANWANEESGGMYV